MFLKIEAGLCVVALVLALMVPNLGSRWFEAIERSFGKLARRRGLSVVVVGLSALALRAALLPILPIPQPFIQDEFAYLLAADTFAHGRLANPTPAMWTHFGSLMILLKPAYMAPYWPGQGLILAAGQVIFGHPFWGVLLSVGIMCAAITWMLQAWIGEKWALLGGFLVVVRMAGFSYWADSYWGGALAAIGGALVLGALPRLKQEHRVRNALLMALGLVIMANSRPYEGLIFSLPIAVALFAWMLGKSRPQLSVSLRQVVLPICLLLGLTAVWMGYYNWRATGSPFNPPYLVAARSNGSVPAFPWIPKKPGMPTFRHQVSREFYLSYTLPRYRMARTVSGNLALKAIEALFFWGFYLGPVFTLPLLLAWGTAPYGFSWKDISPGTRFLLLVLVVTLVGEALPIYYLPHYSAPLTCVVYALVLAALRRIRYSRWRGNASGQLVTRSVPCILILLFAIRAGAGIYHWPPVPMWNNSSPPIWCSINPINTGRSRILARLRRYPGRQLVIVHFGPDHDAFFNSWVYNRADLDTAKVIWAHDMGPEKNQELIDYYKNRRVWLLYADDQPPKLVPYSEAVDGQAQRPAASGR